MQFKCLYRAYDFCTDGRPAGPLDLLTVSSSESSPSMYCGPSNSCSHERAHQKSREAGQQNCTQDQVCSGAIFHEEDTSSGYRYLYGRLYPVVNVIYFKTKQTRKLRIIYIYIHILIQNTILNFSVFCD